MSHNIDATVLELERKRKKQKRLRLLLLLIPIVLVFAYFDWEKKKDDIKHNLTLSDRRALISEYYRSEEKIFEHAKKLYPLYEVDSSAGVSMRLFTDSLKNELNSCLYSKFSINDSIFNLIGVESMKEIEDEWKKKGLKGTLNETDAWAYWSYWEFKEPLCLPSLK